MHKHPLQTDGEVQAPSPSAEDPELPLLHFTDSPGKANSNSKAVRPLNKESWASVQPRSYLEWVYRNSPRRRAQTAGPESFYAEPSWQASCSSSKVAGTGEEAADCTYTRPRTASVGSTRVPSRATQASPEVCTSRPSSRAMPAAATPQSSRPQSRVNTVPSEPNSRPPSRANAVAQEVCPDVTRIPAPPERPPPQSTRPPHMMSDLSLRN